MLPQEFEPHDDGHLAQGDLFYWHEGHVARPWQYCGVIVTADCDLKWGKHAGRISYIPGITMEDYIWHHWRQDNCAEEHANALRQSVSRINNWLAKNRAGQEPISHEAGSYLLREGTTDDVLKKLGITSQGDRNNMRPVIEKTIMFGKLLGAEQPDLALLRNCHQLTKPAADSSRLIKDLQKAIDNPPGDVFHLPSHPEGEDDSLFFMLRHMSQCSPADIATKPDELRFGKARKKRVARIAAPHRYALTQALSRVFADIGLPDSTEEKRASCVSRFFIAKGL